MMPSVVKGRSELPQMYALYVYTFYNLPYTRTAENQP